MALVDGNANTYLYLPSQPSLSLLWEMYAFFCCPLRQTRKKALHKVPAQSLHAQTGLFSILGKAITSFSFVDQIIQNDIAHSYGLGYGSWELFRQCPIRFAPRNPFGWVHKVGTINLRQGFMGRTLSMRTVWVCPCVTSYLCQQSELLTAMHNVWTDKGDFRFQSWCEKVEENYWTKVEK